MSKKCADSWLWHAPPLDEEAVRQLQQEFGLHRLTAACLVRLGLTAPRSAGSFLNCDLLELAEPLLMSGMEQAVDRLTAAVERREPVLVCGDYDADGVTSVAMLTDCFRRLGLPAEYYIPGRLDEGYGLHSAPLTDWAGQGGRLAVTADCGVNSFAEMALARELRVDLIVTDHHQPLDGERSALAVLNPRLPGCAYPEKELAGVGVAWTMVRALHKRCGVRDEETLRYLPLVALGTIADVAALRGENRLLVYHGLARLQQDPEPGLAALQRRARLTGNNILAVQVAYALAPRLNAPGRLGDAGPAVRLLLAAAEEAEALAADLDACNRHRQKVETDIMATALTLAGEQAAEPALVLWHEDWHQGVVGIVAGRLAEQYQRPVVLLAVAGSAAHGSARTVPGVNLVDGLSDCADLLQRFGGHPEAAGLSLETSRLQQFREAFCRSVASHVGPAGLQQPVVAEAELSELSLTLARELQRLQPFGEGNPEPLFLLTGVKIAAAKYVGNGGKHLALSVREGSRQVRAICFGAAGRSSLPAPGEAADLVVSLREDNWQGRSSLALYVCDLRKTQNAPVIVSGSVPEYQVVDRRDLPEKELLFRQLATEEKLAVWVNTQAAQKHLRTAAASGAGHVVRRGETLKDVVCDAAVFYHLPYDRQAVEAFLASLRFRGNARVYLLYGREDLALNEKIFACCQPCADTLYQLSTVPPGKRDGHFREQLNGRLLERALLVLQEIETAEVRPDDFERLLCQSETFVAGRQAVDRFRHYQQFWRQADIREMTAYLKAPGKYLLPEGEFYETGRFEGAS